MHQTDTRDHDSPRVGSAYGGSEAADYFRYQASGSLIKAELNRRKFQPYIGQSDAVLDFGSAGGFTLAALRAGRKVGVEVNEHNVRVAERLCIETVRSLDHLPPRSFDVVLSNHVLEHTLQPYTELCAIRRVLRPRGRLLLHVPLDDWRIERSPRSNDPNHHLYTWSPLLLGNLLCEAGFAVDDCRVVNYGRPGRLTFPLARLLPERAFDWVVRLTAICLKRREVRAVATRPAD